MTFTPFGFLNSIGAKISLSGSMHDEQNFESQGRKEGGGYGPLDLIFIYATRLNKPVDSPGAKDAAAALAGGGLDWRSSDFRNQSLESRNQNLEGSNSEIRALKSRSQLNGLKLMTIESKVVYEDVIENFISTNIRRILRHESQFFFRLPTTKSSPKSQNVFTGYPNYGKRHLNLYDMATCSRYVSLDGLLDGTVGVVEHHGGVAWVEL
ncbi:hypothetical protein LXL04_039079 [Taraxacum kok-saghyz]